MEREVNRKRVEQRTPEPNENTTYKEATTPTEGERGSPQGPPQESGTMLPHD
jgi:hypothetical protein